MTDHLIAGLALLAVAAGASSACGAPEAEAGFGRCAACHLPNGAGVPGSYPPLRDQVARFARTKAGREYLVTVVSHGLTGEISVRGGEFDGFMPAQPLSDSETATVLNFVTDAIAKASPAVKPFSAGEVAAIRRRHASATAQDSRALRPDVAAKGSP
jgi:mono/diheme cytochrome c family protein